MSKDKTKVAERLRAKITPASRQFVRKNLAISEQISAILKEKGWSQKELAKRLGKTESEISKLCSGLHNLTLSSITKLESELGVDIIITPLEACEKYHSVEYITFKVHIPAKPTLKESQLEYVEEQQVEYKTNYSFLKAV